MEMLMNWQLRQVPRLNDTLLTSVGEVWCGSKLLVVLKTLVEF